MLKQYGDRRRSANKQAINYLLDKYREDMVNSDNCYRKIIKALSCQYCFSFNNCDKCKHM